MREYKKRDTRDGYVPRAHRMTALIEACLSPTKWITAEEIHKEINRKSSVVSLPCVRHHLNWHVRNGRRLENAGERRPLNSR
jgi:Fe2+ or Zn2+ uptake regulation protein